MTPLLRSLYLFLLFFSFQALKLITPHYLYILVQNYTLHTATQGIQLLLLDLSMIMKRDVTASASPSTQISPFLLLRFNDLPFQILSRITNLFSSELAFAAIAFCIISFLFLVKPLQHKPSLISSLPGYKHLQIQVLLNHCTFSHTLFKPLCIKFLYD